MKRNKNLWGLLLLIEVFSMVFIIGFLPHRYHTYAYPLVYTLLLFTSAMNLDKYRRLILILAGGAFILEWIATLYNLIYLIAASQILKIIFFVIIVGLLITQISKAKVVSGRLIFEAINGYLLLGLVFSLFIALVVQLDPKAYNFSISGEFRYSDIIYYSFVTLSTLGYGDLLPLETYSKSLALLNTISGQLYIAVIITLLVGNFSTKTL